MSGFQNAKDFFETLEALKGWESCREYVVEGAPFSCQAAAMADVDSVQAYCEWVVGFGKVTAPGATYDLHAASWDEDHRVATFFATYNAKHTGDGGPVPATNQETHSEYVYAIKINSDNKVESMKKIWNDSWALKELGWM